MDGQSLANRTLSILLDPRASPHLWLPSNPNLPHFAIDSHIWIGLPTSYSSMQTNANDVNLQNFISKKKKGKTKERDRRKRT